MLRSSCPLPLCPRKENEDMHYLFGVSILITEESCVFVGQYSNNLMLIKLNNVNIVGARNEVTRVTSKTYPLTYQERNQPPLSFRPHQRTECVAQRAGLLGCKLVDTWNDTEAFARRLFQAKFRCAFSGCLLVADTATVMRAIRMNPGKQPLSTTQHFECLPTQRGGHPSQGRAEENDLIWLTRWASSSGCWVHLL